MIALGRDFVTVAWWLPTFPGLAILGTVLAINLVGDRLRDALDPRSLSDIIAAMPAKIPWLPSHLPPDARPERCPRCGRPALIPWTLRRDTIRRRSSCARGSAPSARSPRSAPSRSSYSAVDVVDQRRRRA